MANDPSLRELLRRRLREPKSLMRQLVVGEALGERPGQGLATRPPPPPPRDKDR